MKPLRLILRCLWLSALFLLTTTTGAESACSNCPTSERPAYPRTGLWFDAQRPGSGINLEVQNGIVAGTIYTYNNEGEQEWFLFSGPLTLETTENRNFWAITAELKQFKDGSCLTCEYQHNDGGTEVGTIEMAFQGRNELTFSIDDSPSFRMRPFNFGWQNEAQLPGLTDKLFPVFGVAAGVEKGRLVGNTKPWVLMLGDPDGSLVYDREGTTPFLEMIPRVIWPYSISPNEGEPYVMQFVEYQGTEPLNAVLVACGSRESIETSLPLLPEGVTTPFDREEPFCFVRDLFANETQPEFYYLPFAELGDDYFKATALNGRTLEAYRLRNRQ